MLSDPKTMVSYYNPALSMFPPGHHHHHSSSAHTATAAAAAAARHSPAATSAAAAAAAQASSYFPAAAAATYGYPHQQFASPYANLSDLNSNMYPGFSSSFDHSAPAAAAAAAAPSWPSAQWAASAGAFASPTSAATVAACRSAYVDSWQTTAADVHPQESSSNNDGGGSGGGGGVTSNHSPGNENNVTSSSAAPAAPTASAAADSPSFANSQSSGSPTGTPTPTYNGGDQQSEMVFSKVFDSPSYVNKLDQQLSSSNSPSHFGLPPSITVTPGGNGSGGLMAAAAAAAAGGDALALSPPTAGSLSPSSNPIQTSGRPQPARSPYEWMKKPSYQSQPEKNGRTRTKDKYRVVYSDHQRLELEKEFHYSRYITIRRKAELASNVGLSERQVKIWFQNRRAKERRALKKADDMSAKEKLDSVAAASAAAMSAFNESLGHHAAAAAAFPPPPPPPHPHLVGHPPPPPPPPPFSMASTMKFE